MSAIVEKAPLPGPLTALSPPADTFYLDQFKNGISVGIQPVTKNRLVFGRAPDCDIQLEHPSISRYHAAVLWSPKNDDAYQKGEDTTSFWYLVDCGSTHGTVCNKVKVDTGKMIKLSPNNNVIKFGASTRFFILGSKEEEENDDDDDEPNSVGIPHDADKDSAVDEGCTWGMQFAECDGEEEETGDSMALKSIISAMKGGEKIESANQNAYSENPYRCIQQWFEREGHHFDFKVETINTKFKCNFELPIDGQWVSIEGELANRKKDAINNACSKCCSILDHAQLLFPWQKQNAKSSRKSDLYDNEDGFDLIDETVGSSKKKQKKSHETETIDNYETLNAKWKTKNEELCKLKVRLATIGLEPGTKPEVSTDITDSLDAYLAEMNKKKFGLSLNEKIEKSNLRIQIKQLEMEQSNLEKLIKIAKPPEVKIPTARKPEPPAKVEPSSPKAVTTLSESVDAPSNTSDIKSESNLSPVVAVEQSAPAVEATSEVNTDKNDKVDEPSLLSHHATGQMKPPTERVKVSAKQVRKQRQESIVEAIEKEKKLEKERVFVSPESESDFIGWLPPKNQSGDGKTHLNDKYGY
ncbi:PREDICTED: kanadaptin-like [Rhagoletis zephyria]|uniref:kanadaptin-like n=1 Tax=Rhagoletis zephyria TaxID=28612 RepID=UPI0008117A4D|nr:PREDICTED: kanadaptin-like [Rhagoletis zephyria]